MVQWWRVFYHNWSTPFLDAFYFLHFYKKKLDISGLRVTSSQKSIRMIAVSKIATKSFRFFEFQDQKLQAFKSDGLEISTKILISWQELKNRFLSFFVHK